MRDVYVAAVGLIPFGRHEDKSVKDLARWVMGNLFGHTSLDQKDLQAAWMSNAGWGMADGQHCIRGQVALAPLGISDIPIMNVENACAGGASAFHGAWLGVAAEAYDVALAVGVEKMSVPKSADAATKKKSFDNFIAGTDVEVTRAFIENLKVQAEQKRKEMEASGEIKKGEGSGDRSAFMDIYSMAARAHMKAYGTTQEQLAAIAAKNHCQGALNPDAQYKFPMTTDEVMNDRLVSFPLTRAMCAPMGDGAAAAVLVSGNVLDRLDGVVPIKIRASVLAAGGTSGGDREKGVADRAYEVAGLGPQDVDFAEVHDATAFGELVQTEKLGFCKEGEGGPFAESGATAVGGDKPVNPSGGLECRGHPIGATGLAQVAELVYQLRGEAGERQVEGARIGLSQNAGGFLGMGEAALAIHILEGPGV